MKLIEEEEFKMEYNEKHDIIPKTIIKDIREVIEATTGSGREAQILVKR